MCEIMKDNDNIDVNYVSIIRYYVLFIIYKNYVSVKLFILAKIYLLDYGTLIVL